MTKFVKTLIVAVLFILAITFALENQQMIALRYYGVIPPFSVPVFLLVFFSVLLGILIAGFGDMYVRFSLKGKVRKYEKAIKKLQAERDALKRAENSREQDKEPPKLPENA
jgi:uncharacterized integral membrane protein